MVERYSRQPFRMDPSPIGQWIHYSDYTTLESEVSRLTALLDEAKGMALPFARIAEAEDFSGTPDGKSIIVNVNLCRAARAFAEKAGA